MKRNPNYQKKQIKIVLKTKPKVLLMLLKKKLLRRKLNSPSYFVPICISDKSCSSYSYVAGGEGDKGLVGTVKEKAAEAYVHYFTCSL